MRSAFLPTLGYTFFSNKVVHNKKLIPAEIIFLCNIFFHRSFVDKQISKFSVLTKLFRIKPSAREDPRERSVSVKTTAHKKGFSNLSFIPFLETLQSARKTAQNLSLLHLKAELISQNSSRTYQTSKG